MEKKVIVLDEDEVQALKDMLAERRAIARLWSKGTFILSTIVAGVAGVIFLFDSIVSGLKSVLGIVP